MSNRGIAPPGPGTLITKVRDSVGDTQYVALNPAESGFGSYNYFSDGEISAFLLAGSDNITRATGYAILALARNAGLTGKAIATDDLRLDISKRGDTLEKIAQSYFDQADAEDARVEDAGATFTVTPFVGGYANTRLP